MREPRVARAALTIARSEVARLARDRRALFLGILLPALVYPLLFHGQAWLRSFSSRTLADREVRVALDLEAAPEDVALGLEQAVANLRGVDCLGLEAVPGAREALERVRDLAGAVHEGRLEALARRSQLLEGLLGPEVELLVSVQPHPVLASRPVVQIYHDGSSELSNEALARVELALAGLEISLGERRIAALLGAADPARGLDVTTVDLASEEATGGARLGRLLPLLAVLVFLSGGSFAALSVLAGEREAGTLETLLVQPIDARAVAWGKFYAVLAVGLAALCCNVGSLFVSLSLGLGALPGLDGAQAGAVALAAGGGRLGLAALVFLPSAVLLAGLLALTSARARSFRSGQQLLLPLTIAASVPAAVAGFTELALDPLWALVPLLGPSLSIRDALRGTLHFTPAALAFLSGAVYAALALRALVHRLSAERLLQQPDTEREADLRGLQARTAQMHGLFAALGSYLVGGWLQARFGLFGLLATLWVFLPLVAWHAARTVARRAGEPLGSALYLGPARWHHLAGALLLAPALAGALRLVGAFVQRVAPLPARLVEEADSSLFEGLGPLGLFFVLALSPGVSEELCFRGAVLSGLRRDLSAGRAVALQALCFALAHASVHRFAPTLLVGLALGALTLRARSIWPAVLLHVAYDGLQVLVYAAPWTREPSLAWLALPGLWLLVRAPEARGSVDATHADGRGAPALG